MNKIIQDCIEKCERALREPRDPDHPETLKIKKQLARLRASRDYLELLEKEKLYK